MSQRSSLLFCLAVSACKPAAPPTEAAPKPAEAAEHHAAAEAADKPDAGKPGSKPTATITARDDFADGVVKVGQDFGLETELTLTDLFASPDQYTGKAVRVRGTVKTTCTEMGCWMTLAAADGTKPVRIVMKDHAFFVPKDSTGALALVEGEVRLKKLDAEQVKHLEGEGAKFENKDPSGAASEIAIDAYAVELKRPTT